MQLFRISKKASGNYRQDVGVRGCLVEPHFRRSLESERQRCERSGNSLLLALVRLNDQLARELGDSQIAIVLRATDAIGWYEQSKVLGLILTDLRNPEERDPRPSIEPRLRAALGRVLKSEQLQELNVSFHFFPEPGQQSGSGGAIFYSHDGNQHASHIAKRCVDLAGSAAALIVLSPLFVIIALAVKLTSRGSVWHRQTRMGERGKTFTMLKFRTMMENCDPKTHREYMTRLIGGKDVSSVRVESRPVYKLVNDPRVTPLGRLLRRSSLDEVPQLFNILKGEMSLVGPRPPLPYECEQYSSWHWRRVMEVKPGLTGLWQVRGRSQTSFDEMVRLDLQYIQEWSLWLDLKILLQTPSAVLSGTGAY
jgi:lipopolysaccharide/colanic/teichoic acid biosynthesis glycosyltransferase